MLNCSLIAWQIKSTSGIPTLISFVFLAFQFADLAKRVLFVTGPGSELDYIKSNSIILAVSSGARGRLFCLSSSIGFFVSE